MRSLRATVVDISVNQISGAPPSTLLFDDETEPSVRVGPTYIVRPLLRVVTWTLPGGPSGL